MGWYTETRPRKDEKKHTGKSKHQFLFGCLFLFLLLRCSLNTYMCVALLKAAFMFDVEEGTLAFVVSSPLAVYFWIFNFQISKTLRNQPGTKQPVKIKDVCWYQPDSRPGSILELRADELGSLLYIL